MMKSRSFSFSCDVGRAYAERGLTTKEGFGCQKPIKEMKLLIGIGRIPKEVVILKYTLIANQIQVGVRKLDKWLG
jgi:hypothetical protein